MRPPDLPSREDFQTRPHGTRVRYVAGCRCLPCRAANSRYQSHRDRQIRAFGRWNGLVPSGPVRAHLRRLSRRGLGYKRVARLAKCNTSTLAKVLAGTRPHLRAQTAKRILEVRATLETLAPGAKIDGAETWRLLDRLIADGYPKRRLARWLGYRESLQLNRDVVTVRNARRVRKLYDWLEAEADEPRRTA